MVLGAIIGGVLGIGASIIGQKSQRDAAEEQRDFAEEANELDRQRAEAAYQRALAEWEIDFAQRTTDYYWQVAATEQARFVEAQKEYDFVQAGSRLIRRTIEQYQIDSSALYDQFVTQEALRAQQVSLNYQFQQADLRAESNEEIRQYMQNIMQRALESSQVVMETENEARALFGQKMAETAQDELRNDIAMAKSVLDAGSAKGRVGTNTGTAARREQYDALARAAREYDKNQAALRARNAEILGLNKTMDRNAIILERYAQDMQNEVERMKFSSGEYKRKFKQNELVLETLDIPSFQLAENQYVRELQSLQLDTRTAFEQATVPFRRNVYFDPLPPIKGLEPTYFAPTPQYVPSVPSFSIGSALVQGITTANQFQPGGLASLF